MIWTLAAGPAWRARARRVRHPVIGMAKSRFRMATHAVPVVHGSAVRPLFVTAAGMPGADAADLVRRIADRYQLPDALRRPMPLARAGPPAVSTTDRQPN
jgi:deoxyribonuclease V